LKEASIKKMILKFGIPSFGGAVAEGNLLFAVSQRTKKLHQISLPDEVPKKVSFYKLFFTTLTEDVKYSKVKISPNCCQLLLYQTSKV
jgi:hypothetical protein